MKKKIKRSLSIILTLCMAVSILAAFPLTAFGAEQNGLGLDLDLGGVTGVSPGDEVTVRVSLLNYDGPEIGALYSINVVMDIDEDQFTFVSLNDDALFGSMGRDIMLTSGYNTGEKQVRIGCLATTATATISRNVGDLFEVTLKVNEALAPEISALEIPVSFNIRYDSDRTATVRIPIASIVITAEKEIVTPPPVTVVEATPSASVNKLNGNKNDLTITIVETLSDGSTNTITETISIDNNAAGTYDVGGYKVYADTKGNTQIRECYIVW